MQDAIILNDKLFQRIQTVYDQRDSLKLDPESQRLIEVVYANFVHGRRQALRRRQGQAEGLQQGRVHA